MFQEFEREQHTQINEELLSSKLPDYKPAHPPLVKSYYSTPTSVEIIHSSTLTSNGLYSDQGQLECRAAEYLDELQQLNVNGLYLVGAYKTSAFSELIMPYFARSWAKSPENWSHVGPSVFAVDELAPAFAIQSWDNLRRLSDETSKRGIKLIVDFIPNTIGIDSVISRLNPDLICDAKIDQSKLIELQDKEYYARRSLQAVFTNIKITELGIKHELEIFKLSHDHELIVHSRRESSDTNYKFYLERNLKTGFTPYFWMIQDLPSGTRTYCKELGRDTLSGVIWADVARLKTDSSEVQSLQVNFLAHLHDIVPIVRADMSHIPGIHYWRSIIRTAEASNKQLPEIWGEAYGHGRHSELAELGIKSYANWIREWLRNGDIASLMKQIHQDKSGAEFLRNNAIVYSANHDDERGQYNLIEGAISAILVSLPVPVVMFAQGQRQGDENRYGADQHVPWQDFDARAAKSVARDPEYAAFMKQLVALASSEVFRSPKSSCRPVHFANIGDRDPNKIFHVIRELENEKVIVVVDFQPESSGPAIAIDLAKSFPSTTRNTANFVVRDLLGDSCKDATTKFELLPRGKDIGYNVFYLSVTQSDSGIS